MSVFAPGLGDGIEQKPQALFGNAALGLGDVQNARSVPIGLRKLNDRRDRLFLAGYCLTAIGGTRPRLCENK